jgi:hypothetical protein
MLDILFNFKDGELISTHINGKNFNFSKINQALEYAKKSIEATTETKFSIQYDAGTVICIYVMGDNVVYPITFNTGHIFPSLFMT